MKITVLAGGPGAEREVSLQSGQAVHQSLRRLGYDVELRDIDPQNLSALDATPELVFIALHGEFGEDGTLQAELEARGIPFCGSGAAASRAAMDKVEAKRRCIAAGIPTPAYEWVVASTLSDLSGRFGVPAVVKPARSGSSVDTLITRTSRQLQEEAQRLISKYGGALVERYIEGPELTVGILGGTALPVCEIRTRREFYDYQAKYIDDDTEYLFDLSLPTPLVERVRALSLAAHRVLGCRGFSRVDWKVDAATSEPMFLEVNTIPGFTSHSLLPKAAGRIGLSFDQLCHRIVELSLHS